LTDQLSRGVWAGVLLALGGVLLGMLLTLAGAP